MEQPAEIQEVEAAELAKLLEGVDLTVPDEFLEVRLAAEMVQHLGQYHSLQLAIRAARHAEQHQRAEQLQKEALYTKTAIALIQHQYPGTKAIAQEMMQKGS